MNGLAFLLATWFGCGKFPWGPGTIGSLAALLIASLLQRSTGNERSLLLTCFLLVLLWPAIWASGRVAQQLGREDPGIVVVDEVLGQWTALLGTSEMSWKAYLAAFVLFRLFDIWKPPPVRQLERLRGGIGIVADDLAAGVLAALILYLGGALKVY